MPMSMDEKMEEFRRLRKEDPNWCEPMHQLALYSTTEESGAVALMDWDRARRRLALLNDSQLEDIWVAFMNHQGHEIYQAEIPTAEIRSQLSDALEWLPTALPVAQMFNIFLMADPLEWEKNRYKEDSEAVRPPQGKTTHETSFLLALSGLAQAARIKASGTNIPDILNNLWETKGDENLGYYPMRGTQDAPMPLEWNPAEAIAYAAMIGFNDDEA